MVVRLQVAGTGPIITAMTPIQRAVGRHEPFGLNARPNGARPLLDGVGVIVP
jgi:hypothetical protein